MMSTKTAASRCAIAGGALTLALGLIHCAAAGVVLPAAGQQLTADEARTMAYMFIATGLCVAYLGALILYCARRLARDAEWARPVGEGAAAFTALLGAGAVAAMPLNPFAYLMLAVAVFTAVSVMRRQPAVDDRREASHV